MVFPDKTNLEVDDSDEDSIEGTKTSWFVWLVAFTASIAGSLFGYDTDTASCTLYNTPGYGGFPATGSGGGAGCRGAQSPTDSTGGYAIRVSCPSK